MNNQTIITPSSLVFSGIEIKQKNNVFLFQFTEQLQSRSEELLAKKGLGDLTPDEQLELDNISELSRIFTIVNSKLALNFQWSIEELKQLSDKEQTISANIAIPLNI
jgi:hypothetical protein